MDENKRKSILEIFEEKKLVTVCAPMVRYSKIQFRTLVREYNCDVCYTPMILADSFCRSEKARNNEFATTSSDFPLIVQFAAKTVHDFVGASYMVSPYCSGVDLNCGCPQTWAKQMGIGCAMLNNPELISDIVKQCRNQISKPFTVSAKLRVLKDIRKTVEIARCLEKAGISFLAVHARTPSQHDKNVDVNGLKLVVENVNCPVIGNGGVKNFSDCLKLQEDTNAKGIMAASGILTNPSLFAGTSFTLLECIQKWLNICYNSTLDNYSISKTRWNIPEQPLNLTFQCFHHHLVFMLEKVLTRNKRRIFNSLQNFRDVLLFLDENLGLTPQPYTYDIFKERKILYGSYTSKDDVYQKFKSLYNVKEAKSNFVEYNYDDSEGKFFKTKLKEDESDFGLGSMFI
ncbi:hypothetical protein FQA39_LY09516 [Lamprigera yunnana]|nr:hypothetical protein FQA39_LY09516 [Lamprigera yunnana]